MSKTIIIIGRSRSGTSLTSGILSRIGVDMRESDNPTVFNPSGAFENPSWIALTMDLTKGLDGDPVAMRKAIRLLGPLVKRRNTESELWGFKSAIIHKSIDYIMHYVENPHFIFVFRNPYTTAESDIYFCNPNVTEELPAHLQIDNVARSLKETADFLEACSKIMSKYATVPMMSTTFEGIRAEPVKEARLMADFVGVKLDPEKTKSIYKFVLPTYKSKKVFERGLKSINHIDS